MNVVRRILFYLLIWLSLCGFEWPLSEAAFEGLSPAELDRVTEKIAGGVYGSIESLVIVRNGKIVYNQRFNGYAGQLRPVFSVTKSFGATLIGLLFDEGLLELESSLLDYFPQYPIIQDRTAKQSITVEHLLQQRHGFDWDEWTLDYESPDNPVNATHSGFDWFLNILNWPMGTEPGARFAYSSGASTLMSGLIWDRTGLTTQHFAQQRLFAPLDIRQYHWEIVGRSRQMGSGSTDFPNGIAPLGFSLWLGPLDMAKLGQLHLQRGVWEGSQLLSDEWIELATKTYSNGVSDPATFGDGGFGHGFQWWTGYFEDSKGRSFRTYYASGWGRQYVFVLPELDMVVVSLAADFDYTGAGIGTALREHILPGVAGDPREWQSIDEGFSGSWYDPDMPGQGFNVEVLADRNEVLVYWFTYTAGGEHQRWFFAQGPIIDNVAKLTIKSTQGGIFSRPSTADVAEWGVGEMMFASCTAGLFRFKSELEDVSAEMDLDRLSGNGQCENSTTKHNQAKFIP